MFARLRRLISGNVRGSKPRHSGFMCRLARSKRAATLPMMAAAVIPLVGIIGGAVDMSRIYLVKTKMQQACDGGALAARRAMTGQIMVSSDTTTGQNFFNANLLNGAYGVQSLNFVLSDVRDAANVPTGAVHGRATATLPLTLMRVFWRNGVIPLTVDCEANLNISNNDVMFVLDTTGSMSCLTSDSDSTCGSYASSNAVNFGTSSSPRWGTTEKANSRIDGLRIAVENFAATLSAATPTSARLRIGFVPYSENASVGKLLYAANTSWLNASADYMSREANFNTPAAWTANTPTNNGSATIETYASNISAANCTAYGNNQSFTGSSGLPTSNPTNGGPAPIFTWNYAYTPSTWGGANPPFSGTGTNQCKRSRQRKDTTYTITAYGFTNWSYSNTVNYDLSTYLASSAASPIKVMKSNLTTYAAGGAARTTTQGTWNLLELAQKQAAGTASGMTLTDSYWDGCILERTNPVDDVDTAPTSAAASKWTPAWADIIFNSGGSQPVANNYSYHYACSKAAQRLNTITSANLATVGQYVNVLNGVQITSPSPYPDFLALGYTYHDIGMMWGVRLMSTNGLFASDHGAAPNGKPVNRHIIFMTDGDMQTTSAAYSAYGFDGSGDTAHNTRFLAACQEAKDHGISVWVVSFAQTLTTELTQCADSGQSFQANDAAELNTMFQRIAQRIAELRLVS